MSKGPGKLQRAIFDVLMAADRPLKTAEVFDELRAFGTFDVSTNRHANISSVLRACHGLEARGAVEMTYVVDSMHRGQGACLWKVVTK